MWSVLFVIKTRMHSSRMRTGRSLTVCWRLLPGGVSVPGGVVSAPGGGVCSGGRGLIRGGGGPVLGGCLLRGGLIRRGWWALSGVWHPSMD